jgi:hypothetical protein
MENFVEISYSSKSGKVFKKNIYYPSQKDLWRYFYFIYKLGLVVNLIVMLISAFLLGGRDSLGIALSQDQVDLVATIILMTIAIFVIAVALWIGFAILELLKKFYRLMFKLVDRILPDKKRPVSKNI